MGTIFAEVNVSQFSRAENKCFGNKFSAPKQEKVFASGRKHFCYPNTDFVPVSHFSHHEKRCYQQETMLPQQCFLV